MGINNTGFTSFFVGVFLLRYNLTVILILLAYMLQAQGFALVESFSQQTPLKHTNGVAVADYDLDGNPDVFIVAAGSYDSENKKTWNRLLRNAGGIFMDMTSQAGLDIQFSSEQFLEMGVKMGASWGDYDNDGYPDLFLTNHEKDQLWHNQGDGTFMDVSERAGIQGCDACYSSSALWWDYDRDGDLDIYVSDWVQTNRLYSNQGDGTFIDVSETSGLADVGETWTSLPIDVNKDGFQDLYVINDFGANRFYFNLGDGTFKEATSQVGLTDLGHGMGVAVCDYGNDGNFDIYLTNIYQIDTNPFFLNKGNHTFKNEAAAVGLVDAGWGWGTRFFDADHDRDEDLYVVNQRLFEDGEPDYNRFFMKNATRFREMSSDLGVNHYGEARGLEVFDYNKDGDLDMMVTNWNDDILLYNNNMVEGLNWIQIELEGTTSNRNAFGTVVRIKTGNEYQYRLHHGANFLGQSIKPLHFGLGNFSNIDEITIFWPNGRVEKMQDVEANQSVKIKEGSLAASEEESYGENYTITGIYDENLQHPHVLSLRVYPNPVTENTVFQLDLPFSGNVVIEILDVMGRQQYSDNFASKKGTVYLHWPPALQEKSGVFIYRVMANHQVSTQTLLKP